MKDSVSVIIPAYNERESLEQAVNVVHNVLSEISADFEIIVVNDGSTDTTGIIADRIALTNKHVKVIHHKVNKGFGLTFRDGIAVASKEYITGFPADNDLNRNTFKTLLVLRKRDCIVSLYMITMSERELIRKIISIAFLNMMNLIFRINLKYYNGYFICPTKLLTKIPLKSKGFTLFAEIKIRLIHKGVKIIEIPFKYKPRENGISKALSLKNIIQTISFLPEIISDIYLKSSPMITGKYTPKL